MLQYKRVLCPMAFHPNCIEALDVARRCGDREAGTLYLLHVLRPVDSLEISAPIVVERRLEDAVERLRRIIKEQLPDVNAQPILRSGHPVEEIIEAQKEVGAEIIVVARHNRAGLVRMFIGSVAERVVRDAPCTVLTVHPKEPSTR
jgi:universal stress protein A